jgi:hypothetical protein
MGIGSQLAFACKSTRTNTSKTSRSSIESPLHPVAAARSKIRWR